MKLSRLLYRTASRVNDAEIIASGNPRRIVKHYVRKALYRAFGKSLRKVIR